MKASIRSLENFLQHKFEKSNIRKNERTGAGLAFLRSPLFAV